MNACLCCGQPIAARNAYGYCSRSPECRSRYQAAYQDARRPPTIRPAEPCKSCGLPTTGKSGYCKRTKSCDAARKRAEYTPDPSRRLCVRCHRALYVTTPDYIGLCPGCDGSRRRNRGNAFKAQVMLAYGGVCACCGEDNLDFLTIDHIAGGGRAERDKHLDGRGGANFYRWLKAGEFPPGYQVLCFNCNCAKSGRAQCPCPSRRRSALEILQPDQLPLF